MTGELPESASKSQRTYEWIRERILARDFNPGYRLVLSSIAAELAVSTVPVREAIRRLEAEGLVEFERNVGARVAMVQENEYVEAMQALGVLEGAATVLSLPHLTAEDIATAEAVNDQMRSALQNFDPAVFTRLNEKFHRILYARCPNAYIGTLVDRGWSTMAGLRSSTFSFVPERAPRSVEEHDEILQLLRQNADPTQIEMTVRHHKWRTVEAFREQGH
ncbi:GntR family transcriptional regulator [Nesterenkonia sphaerica]|uniref:GntR family transcriptional regulator n=1 Tax=Nesterenkonia sphaerica TaxID=1804988 RepID=A0A5R9AKF6_9MICC|nr:GntR family transcriptional regulator [Nesterenkonia sphaerica]TLP79053.1 GntR family transcriptional regulator [Nesterenkonia sphaerica]